MKRSARSVTGQSYSEKSGCRLPGNSPPWADMQTVIPWCAHHKTVLCRNTAAMFRQGLENRTTVIAPPHSIYRGNSSRVEKVHTATRSCPKASPALHTVDLLETESPVEMRSIS